MKNDLISRQDAISALNKITGDSYSVSRANVKSMLENLPACGGMTQQEKMVVSAYTGVLMVDFSDFHRWVEDYLGHPVWTGEMATKDFWERLKEKAHDDFIAICKGEYCG